MKYFFFFNFFNKLFLIKKHYKKIKKSFKNVFFKFQPFYFNKLSFCKNYNYNLLSFIQIYLKKNYKNKKRNIFFKKNFIKNKLKYLFNNLKKNYLFKHYCYTHTYIYIHSYINFFTNFYKNLMSFFLIFFFFKLFSFFKFVKSCNLKKNLKKKKKRTKKFKKNNFFCLNLVKKKRTIHWKRRKQISKQIFLKHKTFLIKSEFYKIFLASFIRERKFNKNVFLQNQKTLYNPVYFSKNFYFRKKTKKKMALFKMTSNKFFYNNNSFITNIAYNNYFPIYNSHYFLTKKFKKFFKSILFNKYISNVHYYVISFFENFLKKKFLIKSVTNRFFKKILKKRKLKFYRLKKIFYKNKKLTISRVSKFNLLEILELIFYSLYYKDVYILKNWFLRNFSRLHYKNQKKFLSFFKILITDVFETYKYSFGIKGFYFIVKGKIGVTSNAKKKTVFFRIGPLNKSSKNQKIDFQQGVVKASSGSSGLLMIITYI